ncbi:MAG: preprotein translocase subunit SecG [bacterium]
MKIAFMIIHLFVAGLLVGGILIQTSKSEGLGGLGGGSDTVFRGATKGFEGFIDKWMKYLAYGFLVSSFLSAVILPKYF